MADAVEQQRALPSEQRDERPVGDHGVGVIRAELVELADRVGVREDHPGLVDERDRERVAEAVVRRFEPPVRIEPVAQRSKVARRQGLRGCHRTGQLANRRSI